MKIFKYTDQIGAMKILETETIRYTPLINLNDPSEGQWNIDIERQWHDLASRVLRRWGLVFPSNYTELKAAKLPKLHAGISDTFLNARNNHAVFCASKTPTNPAMWAYYAAHHHGAVIGFHRKHPIFDLSAGFEPSTRKLHPVVYQAAHPYAPSFAGTGEKDFTQAYLAKGLAWKHEEEVRMLLPLKQLRSVGDEQEKKWLHPAPSDAVADLILGVRMPPSEQEALISLVRSNQKLSHVEIYQARLAANTYEIEIIPLKLGASN